MTVLVINAGDIACYCPHCGAYVFILGAAGEFECDQCGGEFVIEEREAKS